MGEFGVTGFPLSVGQDRQPLWPDGLIGSITHTAGYCAAAVARRRDVIALGIDIETVGDVTRDLWPTICGASEAAWLASLPAAHRTSAITLIFSAKEAFYKCQYPLTREWLNFHDLIVEPAAWGLDEESGGAMVSVRATRRIAFADHAPLPMPGRYRCHAGFVRVGFALPARSSSAETSSAETSSA